MQTQLQTQIQAQTQAMMTAATAKLSKQPLKRTGAESEDVSPTRDLRSVPSPTSVGEESLRRRIDGFSDRSLSRN